MIANHDFERPEHVKAPPEAIWMSGFAVVTAKRHRRDPVTWLAVFRHSCGCLTNSCERDVHAINDIMFGGGPIAALEIFTTQPIDPT